MNTPTDDNARPAWWPQNPYPKTAFPMTVAEYVAAVPDPDTRTAISGMLMSMGAEVMSQAIHAAMVEAQANSGARPILLAPNTSGTWETRKPGKEWERIELTGLMVEAVGAFSYGATTVAALIRAGYTEWRQVARGSYHL